MNDDQNTQPMLDPETRKILDDLLGVEHEWVLPALDTLLDRLQGELVD